jgi:hypothetical protein
LLLLIVTELSALTDVDAAMIDIANSDSIFFMRILLLSAV